MTARRPPRSSFMTAFIAPLRSHLSTSEAWVHAPREELHGLSWQQYLKAAPPERGVVTECVRGLPELRDMAELHVRAAVHGGGVTTIRLESVATNFSTAMAQAFESLLPPLRLPLAWARDDRGAGEASVVGPAAGNLPSSAAPSTTAVAASSIGSSSARRSRSRSSSSTVTAITNRSSGSVHVERLVNAVAKFDLSQHAPPPDKADHISDKEGKQRLREVLLNDRHLRPLLRGLRLALGYEAMPAWQPPPDIERLSEAVDKVVSSFCQRGWGWECRKQ